MTTKKKISEKRQAATSPIWLTLEEKAAIERLAKSMNMPVGEYLRHAGLNFGGKTSDTALQLLSNKLQNVINDLHNSQMAAMSDLIDLQKQVGKHIRKGKK